MLLLLLLLLLLLVLFGVPLPSGSIVIIDSTEVASILICCCWLFGVWTKSQLPAANGETGNKINAVNQWLSLKGGRVENILKLELIILATTAHT